MQRRLPAQAFCQRGSIHVSYEIPAEDGIGNGPINRLMQITCAYIYVYIAKREIPRAGALHRRKF